MKHITACLLAFGLVAACASADARAAGRPLALDDVLAIEMLGDAQFSPDGTWLAYNLTPPYDRLGDYSYWLYAFALSGHELWVMRPGEDIAPRLQPGLDPAASSYLIGFSPDSRHVLVAEHRTGRLQVVACRTGEDACVRFAGPPDWRDGSFLGASWNERLAWTSQAKFVVPVLPDGRPGSGAYNRAFTGAFLWQAWNTAWSGSGATASEVITTGRDRSGDLAPGTLVEHDLVSGASRVLAVGRFAGTRASPDGRRLAAARVSERDRPSAGAALARPQTHPLFDRRYALTLIDPRSGEARPVDAAWSVDPHSITWSADGQKLAVYGWNRDEAPVDGRFYIIDAGTLESTALAAAGLDLAPNDTRDWHDGFDWWPGPARTALLEEGLAVLASPVSGGRKEWYLLGVSGEVRNLTGSLPGPAVTLLYSDAESLTVMGEDGAWRINAGGESQAAAPPGKGPWRALAYSPNAQHGWANEFRFRAARLRPPFDEQGVLLDAGKIVFIDHDRRSVAGTFEPGLPGAAVIAASRAASAAVLSVRDGAATRLLLVRSEGRPPLELARLNAHLAAVRPAGTRKLSYVLYDPEGVEPPREAETCLLLPPDFEPGRLYPVLVEAYPGPAPRACRTLLDAPRPASVTPDLWAARGFVYFRPHLPLDLARTDESAIAGMARLVERGLDALVAEGLADPERIVLYGTSQGGISSLDIATRSDRFAAVISTHGWADFFSHYFGALGINRYFHIGQNGGDNRWRYDCSLPGADHTCPFGFGVTALDDPEAYARASPVARAAHITAPVMLVHSDLDYFDMSQYDEMFGALDRAGKEARYVRYWGEGHSLSSPANIRDLWQRIDGFLRDAGVLPAKIPVKAGPVSGDDLIPSVVEE
jgi:dipeptidyl aminopeptidase/acylaminoacyl peptidase